MVASTGVILQTEVSLAATAAVRSVDGQLVQAVVGTDPATPRTSL